MKSPLRALLLLSVFTLACAHAPPPHPGSAGLAGSAVGATCDVRQGQIARDADHRASPWSIAQHLAKNFPDGKAAWLMPDGAYQRFVVSTHATHFGRCDPTGCYLFAAPSAVIAAAVHKSMTADHHDPAVLGQALGLPAKNFAGPLRMMTLDLSAACARLPVDSDPGVWKCQSAKDTDCFKFGGYTSGGVPEVMLINAPVSQAQVTEVP